MERKLRIAGCYLKREGGSHSIWINPKNGVTEAVPRHKKWHHSWKINLIEKSNPDWLDLWPVITGEVVDPRIHENN